MILAKRFLILATIASLSWTIPVHGSEAPKAASTATSQTFANVSKSNDLPAFPGAEGFGALATGGRGGRVLFVTNLNDSGAGSLREALQATGARTVVFRTGGTIELYSPLEIENPDVTIAGQTAPGDGITLKNHPSNDDVTLNIATSNVILRYLRVRTGPSAQKSSSLDSVRIADNDREVRNVIIDHCSFSWGVDEVLSVGYDASDVTVQWTIVSEGLHNSSHSKGSHSKGVLIGEQSTRISLHHNLIAHNDGRNPRLQGGGVDVVNNVVYNAGGTPIRADDDHNRTVASFNFSGNTFKAGPDSRWSTEIKLRKENGLPVTGFVQGNIGPNRPVDTLPQEAIVDSESREFLVGTRHAFPLVSTTAADQAYDEVLAGVGCTFPARDSVDVRVVAEVSTGTGSIIDDPSDVGGWPILRPGVAPIDQDNDGVPDAVEMQNGWDSNNPSDSQQDSNGNGYTNLEEYLNSLVGGPVQGPPTGNRPPTVTILSPSDESATVLGSGVELSGTAMDPEEGELSSAIVWESSVDGYLGTGEAVMASLRTAGSHAITARASDSEGMPGSNSVTVNALAPGQSSVQLRVVSSLDDAEEKESGDVSLGSSDLELVFDKTNQTVGIRFVDVGIPAFSRIDEAYLQFQVDEVSTGPTSLTIRGEASDDAEGFADVPQNVSSRGTTAAFVPWSPEPWAVQGEAGPDQRSPNLAAIVQEIVDRGDWSSGNSVAFIITGLGERGAESYDGAPSAAPMLDVKFSIGNSSNHPPLLRILGPNDGTSFEEGQEVVFVADADDTEDGDLTAGVRWTSSMDGEIGQGGTVRTSLLSAGRHTITAVVIDSAGARASASIAITSASGEESEVEIRVESSLDDAEETESGSMRLTSSDLELIFDKSDQQVGMRFADIPIPSGATITQAHIQFQTDETSTGPTFLALRGQASDDAFAFAKTRYNISSRAKTQASVQWVPGPWTQRGEAGNNQQTPDIATLIQEIVDRPGWSRGNALAILISGTGERGAESYDGDAAGAPVLRIKYMAAPSQP